jgi:hypothetical protein
VKKSLSVLLFLLINFLSVFGQKEERNKKSDYPFIKPELILDGRLTLVSNEGARLGGLRLGVEMNRVNRFGLGFYAFSNGVQTESLNEISPNIVSANLELNYASLYYERVILFTKKFEWSSTLHVGAGNVSGSYAYANGITENYDEPVQLSELSTTFYRHLTYFMSVGGGIGYRQTRNAPKELLPIYNAPIFIVKLRFLPIKAVRGIWNKDIRKRY